MSDNLKVQNIRVMDLEKHCLNCSSRHRCYAWYSFEERPLTIWIKSNRACYNPG